MASPHRIAELTAPEVAQRLAAGAVAILPMGSLETHGPQAPMGDYLLAEAIAQLPPRCREVFIARKVHGLSQRETAAQLGMAAIKVVSGEQALAELGALVGMELG